MARQDTFPGYFLEKYLSEVKEIELPLIETEFAKNIYWVFGILINPKINIAKNIISKLRKLKIGTRPFFYPMHKQPILKKMEIFNETYFPVSEKLYEQGLYLPSGLTLTEDEIKIVCQKLKMTL